MYLPWFILREVIGMTVNKSLKKLYTKGELRLADTIGGEILIKKNPKGGWIVNWLDMVSYMNIKEYVRTSDLREIVEHILNRRKKLLHPNR